MGDRDKDDEDEEVEAQSSDEVTEVLDPNTPTRQSLPSTVVTKRRCIKKRARKARSETT